MDTFFLIVVITLTLGAAVITLLACAELHATRRTLRATQTALLIAQQAATDEEARKESALRLLDEQRRQLLNEHAAYTARLDALEIQYADALRMYRIAYGEKLIPFTPKLH